MYNSFLVIFAETPTQGPPGMASAHSQRHIWLPFAKDNTRSVPGEAGNYCDFSPGGWLKKVPVARNRWVHESIQISLVLDSCLLRPTHPNEFVHQLKGAKVIARCSSLYRFTWKPHEINGVRFE